MKTINFVVTGVLFILLHMITAEKILFLLPIASKSHTNFFDPFIRAIAERGHDVVSLTSAKAPRMPSNVRQIQICTMEEIFGEIGNPFEMRRMGKVQALFNGSFDAMYRACARLQKTDQFLDLLTKDTFDLVVVDILMNFCVLHAVPVLKAPSILVTTFATPPVVSDSFGNRLPPSFVPETNLNFGHSMTFTQRLTNVIGREFMQLLWHWLIVKGAENMYRESFPSGESLPGVYEIQANASMIFSNSHFALNHPRPLLPDVIEVGGLHTRPAKPLPKDLDEFLSGSAEAGFIFFSLGSIIPAKVMPEEYRQIFIRVFSRMKQRIVWKWETEYMPDVPPNVLLKKWLPQQDILGHPNIKIFMTHGGLLSTQEAAYHGVPLLGFPIFGDQDLNVMQAETAGYAKYFEILDLTEEKLEHALNELLKNPAYYKKAKELSVLVRDVPETPLEKAIFWTEYVLRHKGATHLRSAARELNFFQYYVLDVALALLLICIIALFVSYKIFKSICRRLWIGKVPKTVIDKPKSQ